MGVTLIKNGTVVSPTGSTLQDVLIDGQQIVALGAPGYFSAAEEGADKVIDAAGKYVIPGGVDVHTHMELPFGGTFASDSFETGSNAAACSTPTCRTRSPNCSPTSPQAARCLRSIGR